jgi:hypothetical protein
LGGDPSDALGQAVELSGCVYRGELANLRWAEVDPHLSGGQVGRFGRLLRRLGRGDDDDRRRDAEGEGDGGERRSGTGLVADEVAKRQPGCDGDSPGEAGEDADRQRAYEQAADDGRHDPGDDQRRPVSV